MSFLIVIAAAATLGGVLLRSMPRPSAVESWIFRLLAGLCMVALLAFAIGHGSLFWTQALLALAALLGLAGTGLLRWQDKPDPPGTLPAPPPAGPPFSLLEWLAVATVAGGLLLTLANALSPATQWDAVSQYLAAASDYAREGRIAPGQGNRYTGHGQWPFVLYAVAYFPGRELTTALLGWCFGALACASVYILGHRTGGRRCGLLATAMLASAPVFMDQAGGIAADLAFCALVTAALSAWIVWTEERRPAWLLLSGALAGSACGIRPMGIAVCAALIMAVLLHPAAPSRRQGLWFLLAAGLAIAPWWAHTAYFTGNPLFPWSLAAFHGDAPAASGISGTLRALLRFPYEIVMRPALFDGWMRSPGILVLALGVPGLFVGGPKARWLGAYACIGGLCAFFFSQTALAILPFGIAMMIVAALAFENLPRLRRPLTFLLVFSWVLGLALQAAYLYPKAAVLAGRQTRDAYLAATIDRYPAFLFANQFLGDGGAVLTPDPRTYYLHPPAFANTAALEPLVSWPIDRQARWLRQNNIRYVMLPLTYMRETRDFDAIAPMVHQWRGSPAHFQLITVRDDPRPGGGLDKVEFYRVVDVGE